MTKRTALVYSGEFLNYDFGPAHPLRPTRQKLTYELVRSLKVLESPAASLHSPRMATDDELLLFHDPDYVEMIKKYSRVGSGILDRGDTPAFKGCFEVTALVVGSSLRAAEIVMGGEADHAFNPSGGLHHAHADRASGFCIFNDPAVTVQYLKRRYGLKRLLYLDIDVHHGDGVMYGFYDDPSLLDVDFHEDGSFIFPGTGFEYETGEGEGRGMKVNVPIPPGTGDGEYLNVFKQVVPPSVRSYRPEAILMQCGLDGHAGDELGHLNLTTKTYVEVASMVHQLAHEVCNGRLIMFGGGGYNASNVARSWTLMFAEVAGLKLPDELPGDWLDLYEKLEGGRPKRLRDEVRSASGEGVGKRMERVMAELRRNVPLLKS